jgi:hypothetical protein
MELKPEVVWMGGLALAALGIVVASDVHKRWLIRRAQAKGSRIQKSWLANQTDWFQVGALCIGFTVYLALVNFPQMVPRKLPQGMRALEPLVEWLFKDPPARQP